LPAIWTTGSMVPNSFTRVRTTRSARRIASSQSPMTARLSSGSRPRWMPPRRSRPSEIGTRRKWYPARDRRRLVRATVTLRGRRDRILAAARAAIQTSDFEWHAYSRLPGKPDVRPRDGDSRMESPYGALALGRAQWRAGFQWRSGGARARWDWLTV
jgi:hypothetical protein